MKSKGLFPVRRNITLPSAGEVGMVEEVAVLAKVEVPAVEIVQLAEVRAMVEEAEPIVTTFKVLAAVPTLIVLAFVPPVPTFIV
mgnify:CR=1 FL=1